MEWEEISSNGKLPFFIIYNRFNTVWFFDMLDGSHIHEEGRLYIEKCIFRQDNVLSHKAMTTFDFPYANEFEIMLLPARCPDLNSIENIWEYIPDVVYSKGMKYSSVDKFKMAWEEDLGRASTWSTADVDWVHEIVCLWSNSERRWSDTLLLMHCIKILLKSIIFLSCIIFATHSIWPNSFEEGFSGSVCSFNYYLIYLGVSINLNIAMPSSIQFHI